jgi:protein-L-isoaspartate(D-aspartate) O-methyltransferase
MSDPMKYIDPRVEDALNRIDRKEFVPEVMRSEACYDRPVPIGFGQTCSQPRLVAFMTDLLGIDNGSKVLEIGTGSGFQTAMLLELGCEVYSVEIFKELAEMAQERLTRLGYKNFHIRVGEGSKGWQENAPYDACIFTCAIEEFPVEIITQLKIGARSVYPLEVGKQTQNLMKGVVNEKGEMESEFQTSVLFVPLLKSRKGKFL